MLSSRKITGRLWQWSIAIIVTVFVCGTITHYSEVSPRSLLFDATSRKLYRRILFPQNFANNRDELTNFIDANPSAFKVKKSSSGRLKKPTLQFEQALPQDPKSNQLKSSYHPYKFSVYNTLKDIDLELNRCHEIKQELNVFIDKAIDMKTPLDKVLEHLLKELEHGSNPYFEDIQDLILPELKLQVHLGVVDKFWFRIAGSSTWLEDFGVHYMISRVLYSPRGIRSRPIVSLTYAQIYDKDWNELVGINLVIPPIKNGTHVEENEGKATKKNFRLMEYPRFVAIPFWHDVDQFDNRYYGPEDPRLILVMNEHGYEEPLLVYNSFYVDMRPYDDDEDLGEPKTQEFFRTMFICWPWQLGEDKVHNKVVELKIENSEPMRAQKNWTPFISFEDRNEVGYDRHINFVFRWANLEVLKCTLDGSCHFEYRFDESLSVKNEVGPLRGGTQLFNLHSIIPFNSDKEVWVGFARAHIDYCGCGKAIYRPNLVVVTKETVDTESHFMVTHVSSSLSLNVSVGGWDLQTPEARCFRSSILIPNGISQWNVEKDPQSNAILEDYLTITLSITDFTVHRINIKGLLKEIINLGVLKSHQPAWFMASNDNIVCAIQAATEFCQNYGEENRIVGLDEFADDRESLVPDVALENYFHIARLYEFRGT